MSAESSEKNQGQTPRGRVLLVTQYYWPDPSATAYFMTDIAEGLAARGFSVSVLAGQPSYKQALAQCPEHELRNGVSIQRTELPPMDRSSVFSRLRTQFGFFAQALSRLLSKQRFDVVLSVTCPPMLTWLAPIARATGAAFVPIIHDVYPEIAQVLGKAGAVSGRLFGRLESASLRRSNAVIVLGECQKLVIEQKLGSARTPVHNIPHWAKREVELGEPQPRRGNPWLQRLGIEHKFVIQYSGNIGLFHGVEVLPEAMSLLPADQFHLLLIGEGQKRNWLETEFQRRGVQHVSFVPHGSDAELVDSLAACDVALVCLHPAALGLCVPSKLYGILAAGRPVCVVAPALSESAQTVAQHKAGVVVPPGEPQALADALLALASDEDAKREQGLAARRSYQAHFTRERALDAYAGVLQQVLKP